MFLLRLFSLLLGMNVYELSTLTLMLLRPAGGWRTIYYHYAE